MNLKQDIKKMGGVFSVIMLNEKTGQISGANNLTRIEPVYWANSPDFAVIGNWALTVHLLQFRTKLPKYDPGNLYTFINNICFFSIRSVLGLVSCSYLSLQFQQSP